MCRVARECDLWKGQQRKDCGIATESAVKSGNSFMLAEFWMNVKSLYGIEEASRPRIKEVNEIRLKNNWIFNSRYCSGRS